MSENIVTSDNFEQYLISHPFVGKPENLYNAMNYIMQLGGKRMRPKLLLLAFHSAAGQNEDDAYKLALSIETFHNFSLVHDDIMDNAPLRRGKKTVHEEWNTPTAILAGDNLVIKCYELILATGFTNRLELLEEFTKMAAQVCDGQQKDMNLPTHEFITEEDYLKMIMLKTAVLPACALKMGAMAAGLNKEQTESYYAFGLNLGMAFQLQDDYLDTFGSSLDTGKQEGGDIIENKRTILYLFAEKQLDGEDRSELNRWYTNQIHDQSLKVERVRELFKKAGSDEYLNKLKTEYESKALENLRKVCSEGPYFTQFMQLFDSLKVRTN